MSETQVLETKAQEALTLKQQAAALIVESDDQYAKAAEFLKSCKALEYEIRAVIDPIVEAAHKAHKAATTQRNRMLEPVQEAQRVTGKTMGVYQAKLEEVRRKEEERLRDIARREAEQKAIEDAARLEAESARLRGAGRTLEAEIRESQAEMAITHVPDPIIRVRAEAPKVSNTVVRETWRFEIVDPALIPREFLTVNESAIGAMVRTMKGKTSIPGVRVFSETSVSARA